jgi:hypothetical protein
LKLIDNAHRCASTKIGTDKVCFQFIPIDICPIGYFIKELFEKSSHEICGCGHDVAVPQQIRK